MLLRGAAYVLMAGSSRVAVITRPPEAALCDHLGSAPRNVAD